uniref:TIL domain containing protein n=1 Tax=Rhipicephalus appendiculatus TaxID=34631 RepID=A0A131YND1_RHIAP
MHCTTLLAAAIFCTIASGQEYAGSAQCGCLEVPATSSRQRDKYCRPHMTIPSERHKHRGCVCRLGLVRNAWGDCITKQECTSCKCFRDRDFNVCGRECPLVCNEPMSRSCSKSCAFGCDCLPGFVRNSRMRGRCVKATKCGFTCPQFSSFQFCSSTCAPKCGRHPRGACVTRCTRGDCVCNQGYAEVEHNGETICVPQEQCSRYLQVAPPMAPGGHGNLSSGGSVFVPGMPTTPVSPGVVTGGAAGTLVPGSVSINGNLGGGVSSGGSVFAPGAVPVHPGAISGGTAGTPASGSVGISGNLGGGVNSGGSASVPGMPSIPVRPGVVTSGAAGPSLPGSVGTGGSPHIPSVPAGGTGSVVTIVGGGNQPGSIGISGVLPVPGANGAVSWGTYPQGVAPRPPGLIDAQGRPLIGTNGFGSAGGGIFANGIRPNDTTESGESTAVDATGIPEAPGVSRPGGAPTAAGATVPNGSFGSGSVGSGIPTGITLPNVSVSTGTIPPPYATTPAPAAGVGTGGPVYGSPGSPLSHKPGLTPSAVSPGTTQPPYTTAPGSSAGVGTGGSVYGTPGFTFPHKPLQVPGAMPPGTIQPPFTAAPGSANGVSVGGSGYVAPTIHVPQKQGGNIAGGNSAVSVLISPSGLPASIMPTTPQSVPGFPSVTSGVLTTATNITPSVTGVPSGVLLPSAIPSTGTGLVSNGLNVNVANMPGLSGTNMASTASPAVGGNTPSSILIQSPGGPSTSSVSGSTLVITSTPTRTITPPGGVAIVVGPQSMTTAGGGRLTGHPPGSISTSGPLSGAAGIFTSRAQLGVVDGVGTTNTGLTTGFGMTATPAMSGVLSSIASPSSGALSTGTGEAVGTATNFVVNTAHSRASIATQPVTTAAQTSNALPVTAATTIGVQQ